MGLTVPQHQLTLSGNTAGALASLSSGTVTLAGGNNITLSQAGNAVTISGAAAAGAQTAISGIAASNTTYTSGTVTFTGVGGGVTVSSNTGQRVDISVAAQSVQPETQTFIGGISASNTLYTSGSVRFTGSQAVTVRSGTGQLVVIDAPAQSVQPETQTFIAGIQNSQTTYTSGTVNLSVVAGNLTIRSTTGQAFQFSASQTVQPETQTFVGGIAASNTTYTSGTVTITGVGGGITVSSNTGQRVDLSVAAQSVQTQGVLSVGASTGGNTSGNTTVNTGSRLVFVGSNNITVSQGTAAGATTLTISGPTVGGAQTGISGIANSQTTYTSGTVSLSELGAITIRSTTGNQFQFSVNSQTAQTGISGIANSQTTYTSGTVSWSELGAVTIRSTTGQQYQISVNSQSVQTQGIGSLGVSTGGNTAGNTQVSTGSRLVFAGVGDISLSQATAAGASTISISGSQSVQTQGIGSIGVSTGGNTAGNTQVSTGSRLVFVASGNLTASQGTAAGASTITFSVAPGSGGMSTMGNTAGNTGYATQRLNLAGGNNITLSGSTNGGSMTITVSAGGGAETQTAISGIANSQTTYTSGTVSWSELGAVTIRSTTGQQFQISVNSQTAQTQSNIQALYDGANSISTGTVRLTNANGVTLTINAQTLSASVNESISMHAVSNTTQSTSGTAHKSAMSFAGAGIASVGITGGSVLISVPAGGGAGDGGVFAGVSTMGNTAGSTGTVSTGNFVLVGTGPISLSQSTGGAGSAATVSIDAPATSSLSATGAVSISTNGSTISIGAPTSSLSATGNIQISTNGSTISIGDGAEAVDFWDNLVPGSSATLQLSNAALHIYPLNPANANFPGYMSVQSVFLDVSATVSTGAAFSRSFSLGFYTRVNSTQLSLMASASTTIGTGAAAAGITNSYGGRRWLTIHSSRFNNLPNFSAGSDYFMAIWERSSSGSQTITYQGALLPYATGPRSGILGAASASNTTLGHYPFLGNYSVSFSTAMPNALAASDVNKSNATAISLPRIIFNNIGSNII